MSTLKSDFDCNSIDSIYGSYSSIHDQNPCKGNSSNSTPDTKCSLNHHGIGTGVKNQLVDEYYTLTGLDSCDCVLFERSKNFYSKSGSNWIGVKKIEPWWHVVDKDDLTSVVSRVSSNHNGPMSVEKVLDGCEIWFDQFEEHVKDGSAGTRGLMECMVPESDGDFRDSFNESSNSIHQTPTNQVVILAGPNY